MPKFKDLTGQKINNWIVKEFKGFNNHKQSQWLVECDCAKKVQRIKTTTDIKHRKSCGCLNVENLNGLCFGKWEVISDPITKNNSRVYFKCKCCCDKNTIKLVRSDRLKDGTSTSCGCYALEVKTKHGLSRKRITNTWYGMMDRCLNENRSDFMNYGGRGIVVCEQWSVSEDYKGLKNFIDWAMQNGYNDNLSIERIDVDGDYEPSNCTWITMEDQAKNKRCTIYLDVENEHDKLVDLARENGINRTTLLNRYISGIRDADKLLSQRSLRRTNEITGVSYSNDQKNWRAYINANSRRIELGRRKNKTEAIILRLNAEIKYFGYEKAPQKHLFERYGVEVNE